jgi:hypothetical protein
VSPLVARDWVAADWLSQDLPGLLQKAFAAHMAPGDASADILLVRIDAIGLASPIVNGTHGDGPNVIDSITGAGVVLTSYGRPIASYPLFSTILTNILAFSACSRAESCRCMR